MNTTGVEGPHQKFGPKPGLHSKAFCGTLCVLSNTNSTFTD